MLEAAPHPGTHWPFEHTMLAWQVTPPLLQLLAWQMPCTQTWPIAQAVVEPQPGTQVPPEQTWPIAQPAVPPHAATHWPFGEQMVPIGPATPPLLQLAGVQLPCTQTCPLGQTVIVEPQLVTWHMPFTQLCPPGQGAIALHCVAWQVPPTQL